jgi:hypothetical protein
MECATFRGRIKIKGLMNRNKTAHMDMLIIRLQQLMRWLLTAKPVGLIATLTVTHFRS